MIHQRWYEYGTVFGMRYLFEKTGEGLAMHRHQPHHEHNILVIKGKIGLRGVNEANGTISGLIAIPAPMLVDIIPEQHEIVALEPGTETLHLYKFGKPSEYDHLPDSEKDTTFESESISIEQVEELPWNNPNR